MKLVFFYFFYLLGLNHKRLTYYHNGFERRLTDVHGHLNSVKC